MFHLNKIIDAQIDLNIKLLFKTIANIFLNYS
jgi:hypothetical protein